MKSMAAKERGMTWKGRSAKLSNSEWWWWESGGKRSAKFSNTMLVGGGGGGGGRTGEIEYKQQHGAGGEEED